MPYWKTQTDSGLTIFPPRRGPFRAPTSRHSGVATNEAEVEVVMRGYFEQNGPASKADHGDTRAEVVADWNEGWLGL